MNLSGGTTAVAGLVQYPLPDAQISICQMELSIDLRLDIIERIKSLYVIMLKGGTDMVPLQIGLAIARSFTCRRFQVVFAHDDPRSPVL